MSKRSFDTPRDERLHQRRMKEKAVQLSVAICERNKVGLHPEIRYGLAVANQMLRQHFGLDAYGNPEIKPPKGKNPCRS